jgi:hypothetical protein
MSERCFIERKTSWLNIAAAPTTPERLRRRAAEGAQPDTPSRMVTHALQRAAAEAPQPLDAPVRSALEAGLGRDFSGVRVHCGAESARAAGPLGAGAYTLGNDIHLGGEARSLSVAERSRLLTHEAVHAVQQGGVDVTPHAGLAVSQPNDAAEVEAESIARTLTSPPQPSRSLGLRNGRHAAPNGISRSVEPHLQRDLTGKHPVREGEFALDLKTESHPAAMSGMKGTIKFKADAAARDSPNIRLLQVVRTENVSTGKDLAWTGGEANRNKVMTTEDKGRGIAGGTFVDHSAAAVSPRSKAGDAAMSPYYRDYWPNASVSQDGSKIGKTIKDASLWDFPGSSGNVRFSFETLAQAADTGHVYGTVMWGFEVSDPAKGKIDKERAVGRNVTLLTTDKAIEKFNEFYRNPGTSTAPK